MSNLTLDNVMDGHKYVLIVACEHEGERHYCRVPLMLDGSEGLDEAVVRFRDAITVAKHQAMEHHGREVLNPRRIDGIPTPEQIAADRLIRGVLHA